MALAVAQHQSGIIVVSTPGSISVGWTPTPGHLLITFLHCNINASGITVNTTDWTDFQDVIVSAQQYGMGLYRYVQGGDTSSLPALWTAGATYWAYEVFEISGVTGIFANDAQASNGTGSATSTPLTSSTITTGAANCLALFGCGQYNGASNSSASVGWTVDEVGNNAAFYGSDIGGHQAFASASSAVSVTVTIPSAGSNPCDLMTLVLTPSTAGNVNLVGVSAIAVARSVTPTFSSSFTLGHVAATTTARALTPRPGVVLGHVAAIGVARGLGKSISFVAQVARAIARAGTILGQISPRSRFRNWSNYKSGTRKEI